MKSIDFKSLLIGVLGTALVMVLMGQTTHKKTYDVECITMSGKAGLIKCRRFQLDSHVWDEFEVFEFEDNGDKRLGQRGLPELLDANQ